MDLRYRLSSLAKLLLPVFLLTLPVLSSGSLLTQTVGRNADIRLGKAPSAPQRIVNHASVAASSREGLTVDTSSRQESLDFFRNYYVPATAPIEWKGDHATCDPGTTSTAFRDEIAVRINYFRAMAGVPADIVLNASYNSKALAAALMMSANDQLDHDPPPDWVCYSADGAEGASSSNLSLGSNGVEAIAGYMRDSGGGNYAVGHRRWLLYPQTQEMGSGDIPAAGGYPETNALWVFDDHMWEPRPATREEFVAWPPPGYVPYQIVASRWSFSYAQADFSSAVVSMSTNGSTIPVVQEPVAIGFGENSVVWLLNGIEDWENWLPPMVDTTYKVDISGVIINEGSRDFSYDVIIFDPDSAAPPPEGTGTATQTPSTTTTPTATLTTTSTPSNSIFIPLVLSSSD